MVLGGTRWYCAPLVRRRCWGPPQASRNPEACAWMGAGEALSGPAVMWGPMCGTCDGYWEPSRSRHIDLAEAHLGRLLSGCQRTGSHARRPPGNNRFAGGASRRSPETREGHHPQGLHELCLRIALCEPAFQRRRCACPQAHRRSLRLSHGSRRAIGRETTSSTRQGSSRPHRGRRIIDA